MVYRKKRNLQGIVRIKEKEERGLTGKLQVGEVADGSGNRVVSSSSTSGPLRRPQLGEVVQEVTGSQQSDRHLLLLASLLRGRGSRGGGAPAPAAAAVWAVAHGWCVEAGRRRGDGRRHVGEWGRDLRRDGGRPTT
jgi:hypothetical protein